MSDDVDFESEDALRRQLAGLDPMTGVPVEPVTSPQARHRLEQIMSTEPSESTTPAKVPFLRGRGKTWLAAAAAVTVLAVGTTVAMQAGGDSTTDITAGQDPKSVVALNAPGGDGGPTMNSCIMFDIQFLRQMPVALGGTVTAVDPQKVTLDVDRWYKGGDAQQVTIAVPSGQTSAALDGVDFEQGKRYLITATNGTVNVCGYSGPATPELEKSFDEAFGA